MINTLSIASFLDVITVLGKPYEEVIFCREDVQQDFKSNGKEKIYEVRRCESALSVHTQTKYTQKNYCVNSSFCDESAITNEFNIKKFDSNRKHRIFIEFLRY